jgi:hypothetical protein
MDGQAQMQFPTKQLRQEILKYFKSTKYDLSLKTQVIQTYQWMNSC